MTPRASMILVAFVALAGAASAQSGREHFEKRIRPVLVERCYRCHNSGGDARGGLALDDRAGLLRGGDSGAAIIPGDASSSLLLKAIRHEDDGLRMPAEDGKLSDSVISDFVRWIDDGAFDPRDAPPTPEALSLATSWEGISKRRSALWSWQPLRPALPDRPSIDTLVATKLRERGLRPAPRAGRATLLRRLTHVLTGLPPTPGDLERWLSDDQPGAWERVVDRLLASPAFGERWARHWMDWVRYADSHGSEGDPRIPNAWRYRDYLVRALNADVPLNQLIREHIAGDILAEPRLTADTDVNESVIGAAQFRFVQHGFAPTDALEEQVRFIDNQIDVVTKAFMGLTVSCARCHDHKFDAISQEDYHAFYSTFVTARPASLSIDGPTTRQAHTARLGRMKRRLRSALSDAWRDALRRPGPWTARWLEAATDDVAKRDHDPLRLLAAARKSEASLSRVWSDLAGSMRKQAPAGAGEGPPLDRWLRHGQGLRSGVSEPGGFHVEPEGDRVVSAVLPRGIYSHLISDKHRGVLGSPRMTFDDRSIWLRARGDGGVRARYVVHGYPRGGTVYPIQRLNGGKERWLRFDASYWKGEQGWLELTTAADGAIECDVGAARSWLGLSDVRITERGKPGPRDRPQEFLAPLFDTASTAPESTEALLRVYADALRGCIDAFAAGRMTDPEARFLDAFVSRDLLPTHLDDLTDLSELIADYRTLEAKIAVPRRVPGAIDEPAFPQPLFIRGDHKRKGDPVAPRFLASIDATPWPDAPRLRLAETLADVDDRFVPRVMANRIWHHLFGRGLVATPDNFGHLGSPPTHPELLDELAHRLRGSGRFSLKAFVREVVLSETFRRSGAGDRDSDPDGRWLSRVPPRRLEAEAIRDGILAASGRLDTTPGGPPVGGGTPRRSLYVRVQRNALDPFLSAFDAPAPHTTLGRRPVTAVPAQALTLLNGRFARNAARDFARGVLDDSRLETDAARVAHMFQRALGRDPTARETRRTVGFLAAMRGDRREILSRARSLDAARADVGRRISALVEPVRARLLAEDGPAAPVGPEPIAAWDFDADLRDSIGKLHGRAVGSARLKDGALLLDGRGHVETPTISKPLRSKTLEARVRLDGLNQKAGGVITIEKNGGGVFDAIVFAERRARRWMAGSDVFSRTQDVDGEDEDAAGSRSVHVAITYAADGTITIYRDGRPYGRPYRSRGPVTFPAGGARVVFGLRHNPASGGKRLRGRLLSARLYDRALTAEEVAASAATTGRFVSLQSVLAAMTEAQRTRHETLVAERDDLARRRAAVEAPEDLRDDDLSVWTDVALSLFNLKEFIYLR